MDTFLKRIIWVVLAAPLIYLVVVWNKLPEQVALHFDLNGNANEYGSKKDLLFVVPLLCVIAAVIFALLPLAYKIDPKKNAIENKPRMEKLAATIAIFMSFVGCLVIYSSLEGKLRLNLQLVFGSIGVLWCVVGNYLYNIKPNFFAGFRVPWTLSSEDNWKRTHRLGGKIFFFGGLLIILTALITSGALLTVLFITIAAATTIIPGVYSYILYRKEKQTIKNNL